MKLQAIKEQIVKIGLNNEKTDAILKLIDLAIANETVKISVEIKAINFKIHVIIWTIGVIVLGFLSKFIIGA